MVKQLLLSAPTQYKWKSITHQNDLSLPFYQYEWHTAWFHTIGKSWRPYILEINNTHIASFARNNDTIIFTGQDVTDFTDVFGDVEKENHVWKELLLYLIKDGVKKIFIQNLPSTSHTFAFWKQLSKDNLHKRRMHIEIVEQDTVPSIPLPKTFNAYMRQLDPHERQNMSTHMRRIDKTFSSISFMQTDASEKNMSIILKLMKLNPLKRNFLTPSVEKFFYNISLAFPKDMRFSLLFIDNTPAAAGIHFQDKQTFFNYNGGFNKEQFSGAGMYLRLKNIETAIIEKKTQVNCLRGRESYKYQLGAKDFPIYSITVNLF